MKSRTFLLGRRGEQVAQREDAAQLLGAVDARRCSTRSRRTRPARAASRVASVGGVVEARPGVVGGHDAAGGVLRVAEQLAHVLGVVLLHHRDEVRAAVVGQVGEQVGGVVGRHARRGARWPCRRAGRAAATPGTTGAAPRRCRRRGRPRARRARRRAPPARARARGRRCRRGGAARAWCAGRRGAPSCRRCARRRRPSSR